LFGIPAYVRMLGLMDTVASVGATNANDGEGHWDWAKPENLRIHPWVMNCVHYVALHEFRTVFPVESLCQGDVLPENCYEHYYPGAHADVGGGYAPGAQGKAVRIVDGVPVADDSMKLSQLALNDMYQAARRTCEYHSGQPWIEVVPPPNEARKYFIAPPSRHPRYPKVEGQFALDPDVRSSVEEYFSHCGISKELPIDKQLQAHGLMYLAFRHMVNLAEGFERLYSVRFAQAVGKIQVRDNAGNLKEQDTLDYYRRGQEVFANQIDMMKRLWRRDSGDRFGRDRYSENVVEIYRSIQKIKVSPTVGSFYDDMVHDSYAGFIERLGGEGWRKHVEGQGYLRYRAVYRGDDIRLNSMYARRA
jgi:hypothetical protein